MLGEIEVFKVSTNHLKLVSSIFSFGSCVTDNFKAHVPEIKYCVFTASNGEDQSILDAEVSLRKKNPKVLAVLYSKELWTFSMNIEDPPVPDLEFQLKQDPIKSFTSSSIYGTTDHNPSSLLPLTYVTFLRALKKMLILNLSSRGELVPFGNSGLLPDNKFLQLDPKLASRGDLFLSITTKPHELNKLQELSPDIDFNKNYAIYLAPSGIRAYLAGETLEHSKTTAPSNQNTIIETLLALHSIKLDPEKLTWLKMIPNLGHLNAITTQVSDYLRAVTNSKYLLWPLELCFVQKADEFTNGARDRLAESMNDQFSLIDDFANLRATSSFKTPSNIPTSNNTPIAFESPSTEPNIIKPHFERKASAVTETPAGTHDSWSDLDEELFGEGDGVTDADFNFFDNDDGERNDDVDLEQELDEALEQTGNEMSLDNTDSGPDIALEDKLSNDSDSRDNHFDIPIEEITIPGTPLYTDPGAPEPIQSPKNVARKKSIFSPLNFNPIIRSNVDNKYANGGKFFVSSVDTPTGEAAIPSLAGDKFAHVDDDTDDEDDDEEEEDDEDDDEENDEDEVFEDEGGQDGSMNVTDQEMKTESRSVMDRTPSIDTSASEKIPFVRDSTVNRLDSTEPEFKKLRLESAVPQLSEEQNDPSKDTRIPSPGIGANGSPNCIPFLLRSIPLHSIPSHFYSDTPTVKHDDLKSLLDTFLQQIIWDDGYLSEAIPKVDFFNDDYPESVQRAIAQFFPEIHEANLAELSGMSITDRMFKEYNHDNEIQAESPLSSFKNPEYVLSSNGPSTDTMDFAISSELPKDTEESTVDGAKLFFEIPEPRITVKRLDQEVSVNASALSLWNLMSFSSLKPSKDFRLLLVSPDNLVTESDYLMTDLLQIYHKCQLGNIERLQSSLVKKGVAPVDYHSDVFEENALSAARSLNESLIKGSNYKDIVIILVDFEQDLKSIIKLSQVFEKMKAAILAIPNDRKLQINVKLKIIPSTYISNNGALSILSINKLTKLSLSLYNDVCGENETYASLSSPLPSKINFQLTKTHIAGKLLSEDSFIHLAYGRSIDKEWCAASWTDQFGKMRKSKAWYCPSKVKNSLETVTNEMWDFTVQLSKSLPGKKFLVLTRTDGMIPDDELLQWKRLSSKSRELALVVVSVNENSKLLLTMDNPQYPLDKLFDQEKSFANTAGLTRIEAPNTVGSSTGLTPSAIFTPQPVNSPDLFTISRPSTHESPSDFRVTSDESSSIVNIADKVHALIYTNPSPLANSPTRLSIKTGFLIKPVPNSQNKLATFEINVLSCPGNLPCDEFMNMILIQYRNLATIGELYGVVDTQYHSLIPWHIAAVVKSLNCLVHVRVE